MRLFVAISVLVLSSSVSFAGPCLPGTLQSYINLSFTGCTLGLATFKDFTIEAGQSFATPINPAQIQVTPGGSTFMPSLIFTVNQSASGDELFESFFHFDVSAFDLSKATITLNNSSATGNGAAIASADICPNGSFFPGAPIGCPTSPRSLIAFTTSGSSGLTDSSSFTATSFFDVFTDLTIDGGGFDTANMGSATFQVTAAPEPATSLLVIMGCGSLVLGRFRRHL